MQLIDELLELALDCVHGAGQILEDGQRSGLGRIDTKSSSVDIVTEVDRRSEAFIVEAIQKHRPDDSILGEEGADTTGSSGVRWVIDPLDGTVNFTYGIPEYAVSIGVEINDEPVVGVILNPAHNELFVGVKNGGATRNGERVAVGHETDLSQSLVATGFSYLSKDRAAEAAALNEVLPRVRDIRRAGAASLDVCLVACGRLDGYFQRSVRPWDLSAGYVVATEAGAVATGLDGGLPRNDIVVANPSLHPKLHGLVLDAQN